MVLPFHALAALLPRYDNNHDHGHDVDDVYPYVDDTHVDYNSDDDYPSFLVQTLARRPAYEVWPRQVVSRRIPMVLCNEGPRLPSDHRHLHLHIDEHDHVDQYHDDLDGHDHDAYFDDQDHDEFDHDIVNEDHEHADLNDAYDDHLHSHDYGFDYVDDDHKDVDEYHIYHDFADHDQDALRLRCGLPISDDRVVASEARLVLLMGEGWM